MFFDECHVAFTDTSYRERLRELWTLRYLDCPFTCLTATLMVELEEILRDRLCIPQAQLFRRSTAWRTIQYSVQDSGNEAPSVVAQRLIQILPLGRKRGVIYVRSYATGQVVSAALNCPFYKARAQQKGELLEQWRQGPGGWIVATGALGTGINIEGIVYVVHIDRPYGLTSFAQQSGRGGRNGEISDSIVVTRVQNTQGRRRPEILSEYSTEQVDEDAMTEFLQSTGCRRQVLAWYFDGEESGSDCKSTDSVYCDRCKIPGPRQVGGDRGGEVETGEVQEETEVQGSQVIAGKLQELAAEDEMLIKVMDGFKGQCLFCVLTTSNPTTEDMHTYSGCSYAERCDCSIRSYKAWRKELDLGEYMHCWECGLSQKICRRIEEGSACEYLDIMLPGIYILFQKGYLQKVIETVGFRGLYAKEMWEWMNEIGEGFGEVRESNWMSTWWQICKIYIVMKREIVEEGRLDSNSDPSPKNKVVGER